MLLSLDGTIFVQLINFLIFLVVLNAIFLKPVGAAIAKRRAYIDGVAQKVKQLEADVAGLHAQADERRAAARREAEAIMAQARAAGQAQAADIAADFAARAVQHTQEAHATVAREVATARESEGQIVESLAETLVARAIEAPVAA
jgi:F-type H+-transporting ATPase subunit b